MIAELPDDVNPTELKHLADNDLLAERVRAAQFEVQTLERLLVPSIEVEAELDEFSAIVHRTIEGIADQMQPHLPADQAVALDRSLRNKLGIILDEFDAAVSKLRDGLRKVA